MGRSVLLFPIDTANREVDFRLMMAGFAAKAGYDVLVGQQDVIVRVADRVGGGIYVGQNLRTTGGGPLGGLRRYHLMKEWGHAVVFLDEEGGVYPGDPSEWPEMMLRRFDSRDLAEDDHLCTWGEFQERVYRGVNPPCKENITTTGHPRFDMYKPRWRKFYDGRADALVKRFGRFVLVNMSFSLSNNLRGPSFTFQKRSGYHADDGQRRKRFVDIWHRQAVAMAGMIRLVHHLAAEFPDISIVIRPHPNEDQSYYRTVFAGVQNLHVVHEGAVAPWILASVAMLYDGCTTGLEGYALGANVIGFRAHDDPKEDIRVANVVGFQCRTHDEVFTSLRRALTGEAVRPPLSPEDRSFVNSLIANFDSEISAFDRLLDVINEVERTRRPRPGLLWRPAVRLREIRRQVSGAARSAVRTFMPERQAMQRLNKSKFPGWSELQLAERLDRVGAVIERPLSWTTFSEDLVLISAQ